MVKKISNPNSGENGLAFIEFMVLMPILLTTILASFNISAALKCYSELSSLAYQSVRVGIQYPGISLHPPRQVTANSAILDTPIIDAKFNNKILALISDQVMEGVAAQTSLEISSVGNPALLTVELETNFEAPFASFPFGNVQISTSKKARYLHRR